MPNIRYAFRDDAHTITMLTQGCTDAGSICQIAVLRRREIAPKFLNEYMVLDVKSSRLSDSSLNEYGKGIAVTQDNRRYYAIVDSQIEFIVKRRTMQKLSEFFPAHTSTGLYNFFRDQPCGFLVVLKVFVADTYIPEDLLIKGRMGASQIIALYNRQEKTNFELHDTLEPVIDIGTFEYIKDEILHKLRVEDALIGVYGKDKESCELLLQKQLYRGDRERYAYREEDNLDHAFFDYNKIYEEVLNLDKSLEWLIDYIRNIKPPQTGEVEYLVSKLNSSERESVRLRLFEMYMRSILKQSLYYVRTYKISNSISDLIQDGLVGLQTAIDKYEELNSRTSFIQYYPLWIRNCIERKLRFYLFTRHISVAYYEKIIKIKKYIEEKRICLPQDADLISMDDLVLEDECDFENYLSLLMSKIPLEEIDESKNEAIVFSTIINEVDEMISMNELGDFIELSLKLLPFRDASFLRMRFGLQQSERKTLEEISQSAGLTRERVRQIEQDSLRRIRDSKMKDILIQFL